MREFEYLRAYRYGVEASCTSRSGKAKIRAVSPEAPCDLFLKKIHPAARQILDVKYNLTPVAGIRIPPVVWPGPGGLPGDSGQELRADDVMLS
jgi:hypothetical protein